MNIPICEMEKATKKNKKNKKKKKAMKTQLNEGLSKYYPMLTRLQKCQDKSNDIFQSQNNTACIKEMVMLAHQSHPLVIGVFCKK